MPPHIDDLRHLFDKNRARFHAGAARRALPEGFRTSGRDGADDRSRARSIAAIPAIRMHQIAELNNYVPRRKLFPGSVGRANRSTTSALGTGIEIEQVFPRVVNDPVDPKALTLLKVNLFQ